MAEAEQSGLGIRALAVLTRVQTRFVALPAPRRNGLIAGVVGILAVVLVVAWYAGRPDWRILFSGLEGKDVQQVSQELAAAGIPFETTPDGTGIQVPAESLDKARMEVAAKGMPQSGRLGFELFDKPNWVGSEFDERVNYQRALEGELEHTIATLGVVRSARVHLVLPQASMFLAEQKIAKASVLLKLKRASLSAGQTESIRNLVAGAVENLSPEQVTLVDADGRTNLQARGASAAQGDAEQAMEAKLVAMLEPLAGAGNVRATVNLSYDQGSEERTDEIFDPTQSAPLSIQKTEQTAGGTKTAQGVPGTASNTPAAAVSGAVQGSVVAAAPGTPPLLQKEGSPVYPQASGLGQSVREESGTYAVTRHLVHSESGPGRLQRVTAAVVVNDRYFAEPAGKSGYIWKPRTPEEMHRLEGLAQAAVGFDEKRGDQVVMENVSFSSNAPEQKLGGFEKVVEEMKGLLGQQPGMFRTGMLGLLGVLLVLFVLRPVAGQVVATLQDPALLTGGSEVNVLAPRSLSRGAEQELRDSAPNADTPNLHEEPVKRLRPRTNNAVFDQVSEHIRREPAQSTRLLEAWIGSGKDGEQ
jgi:flagellar M-ring protein FliF